MRKLEIIGYKRANLGKKHAHDLRDEGNVPCVLYGGDSQVHFHSPMVLFRDLIYTPKPAFVHLNIEGDQYECILQDAQFHPVSEVILHADFLMLDKKKEVKMDIPVTHVGTSPGVLKGGRVALNLRKLRISAIPGNMPEKIEIDISGLELGKSVKVRQIEAKGFKILNNESIPVVTIEIPRALRSKQNSTEGSTEEK